MSTGDSQRKEIAEISDLGVQKAPSAESGTANNEVHRKVYEVQENKDHRSVKEDEGDARLLAEKEKDAEAEKAKKKAKEEARKRKEEHEAIYEMTCVEESELRKEGTKKEFCKLYPWARMTMQLCDLAKVICAI